MRILMSPKLSTTLTSNKLLSQKDRPMLATTMSSHPTTNGVSVYPTTTSRTIRGPLRPARLRCEYPSCRKYGHTVDECWKALPELRSRRNHNLAYRPRLAKAPSRPFLFLDLPSELQNRIYEEAYGESYSLTIKEDDDTLLKIRGQRYSHPPLQQVVANQSPSRRQADLQGL